MEEVLWLALGFIVLFLVMAIKEAVNLKDVGWYFWQAMNEWGRVALAGAVVLGILALIGLCIGGLM